MVSQLLDIPLTFLILRIFRAANVITIYYSNYDRSGRDTYRGLLLPRGNRNSTRAISQV